MIVSDLLAAEEHERGRNVVIVLDEAHLLGVDQLEELRLLTNAELDSHSPFACLLVGQPEAFLNAASRDIANNEAPHDETEQVKGAFVGFVTIGDREQQRSSRDNAELA